MYSRTKICQKLTNPSFFNPGHAEPCWTRICPAFANSADLDQFASSEANWSGSALFASQYMNLYQQPGSSNLIVWQLEMSVAS